MKSRANDQAAGLRRMLARASMRVLPLVSVLERAAQARFAVHFAAALSQRGARVMIVDASRGYVSVALGLRPRFELLHLLEGEKNFDEVVLDGPDGLRIVPAARGIESMRHADDTGWRELFGAFAALGDAPDLILLNCASADWRAACRAAGGVDEVVLALETGAESITAAYAMIKATLRSEGQRRYRLLFADAPLDFDAASLAERMRDAAQRFLGVELRTGGLVTRDRVLQISANARQTIVSSDPAHPAAAAFLSIAGISVDWNLPEFSRASAHTSATAVGDTHTA